MLWFEEFMIKVRSVTNRELLVSVTNHTTIITIKKSVASRLDDGSVTEMQRLVIRGTLKHSRTLSKGNRALTDEKTVADYAIKRDDIGDRAIYSAGVH